METNEHECILKRFQLAAQCQPKCNKFALQDWLYMASKQLAVELEETQVSRMLKRQLKPKLPSNRIQVGCQGLPVCGGPLTTNHQILQKVQWEKLILRSAPINLESYNLVGLSHRLCCNNRAVRICVAGCFICAKRGPSLVRLTVYHSQAVIQYNDLSALHLTFFDIYITI